MARSAIGAITILDITDGSNPITAFSTNENHTFLATEGGTVADDDRNLFSTDIVVFLGDTQIPYNSVTTNSTYKIGTVVFSDSKTSWPLSQTTTTVNSVSIRRFSLSSTPSGVSDLSVVATIPVIVTNGSGGTNTINVTVSLQKQIAGATGIIINMVPDKQVFSVNADGLEIGTQSDATILIELTGAQGTLSVESSVNGAAYSTAAVDTSNPIVTGTVKSMDLDGTGDDDNIVVSIENFLGTTAAGVLGTTTNTVSYKVSGTGGGVDVISFSKIPTGKTGAGAILVTITSNSNGNVFKNSTGTAKTLVVNIFDSESDDGRELAPHTFTNGAISAGATSITVDSTSGFPTAASLLIGSDVVSYTGKTSTTFTGIPSTGANAILVTADNVLISLDGSPTVKYFWFEKKDPTDGIIETTSDFDRNVVDSGVSQSVSKTLVPGGTNAYDRLIVGTEDVDAIKNFSCLVTVVDS